MARLVGAKLKLVAEGLFTVVRQRSTLTELALICEQPGCGDQSGNRSVNLETGKTNCWRCGKGGDFLAWIKTLGHDPDLTDNDLYEKRAIEDLYGDLDTMFASRKSVVAYVNDVKLPRGFTPISEDPASGYARLCARMSARKNLDLETFERVGAGFTRDDPYWEPFCIFPIVEWGKTVYFQGRTYTDPKPDPQTGKKRSTKKFPSRDAIKLGSRYWIYNIDRLRERGRVALVVESIFNVLSLENLLGLDSDIVPVAIFKHHLSPEQQAKLLTATGVKEIALLFDPDAIGAAWASCSKLINLRKVTVVDGMPRGVDANDDAALALRCFEKRRTYTTFNRLEASLADL